MIKPTLRREELYDLHFGPSNYLIIDFGDDENGEWRRISTDPRFEPLMEDLLGYVTTLEELVLKMNHLMPGPRGQEIMLTPQQAQVLRLVMEESAS